MALRSQITRFGERYINILPDQKIAKAMRKGKVNMDQTGSSKIIDFLKRPEMFRNKAALL
jgi:hypothetical protein